MATLQKRVRQIVRRMGGSGQGKNAINTKGVVLELCRFGPGTAEPSLLPQFKIRVNGVEAGHISTGHVLLFDKFIGRGNIFFSHALPQYEAFHLEVFRQGLFEEYKRQVIKDMNPLRNRASFVGFVKSLKRPTHIEFWRLPNVARKYMEHGGYDLCKTSIRELEKRGLPKKANKEQIIEFLRTFENEERVKVLFLLTKPAKI
jgi:hypothetical protein